MIISDSHIDFSSHRTAAKYKNVQESLRFWHGPRPDDRNNSPADKLEISNYRPKANNANSNLVKKDKAEKTVQSETDSTITLNSDFQIIKMMFKDIFGEDAKLFSFDFEQEKISAEYTDAKAKVEQRTQQNQEPNWGMEYDRKEIRYEYERTKFEAKGIVNTADGKQVKFSINIEMQREMLERNNISVRAGNAVTDPLVLNFNGKAADLQDRKFAFDINADGRKENISYLTPGSGFLAFDRNLDGRINNGNELFGARTGDGFAELAGLDDDNNGWIDEKDSAFNNLRIWEKDHSGRDKLYSLRQKQVGAVYLNSASTLFNIHGRNNQFNGQIDRTGVFLDEQGNAGTVQKVNFSV